jgi:hypothetical protein
MDLHVIDNHDGQDQLIHDQLQKLEKNEIVYLGIFFQVKIYKNHQLLKKK